MTGTDRRSGPRQWRLADLAADPAAAHWAEQCGWVPGSGYCRNRDCTPECLFAHQRESELTRLVRARRRRRQQIC